MSHNVSPSQNPNAFGEIGRLTIAATPKHQPHGKRNTLRVSRVAGGLRFANEEGPTHVYGEDLFVLREFLAELPEELFVRPADPVEKVPMWSPGDVVSGNDDIAPMNRSYYVRDAAELWHEFSTGLAPNLARIMTDAEVNTAITFGSLTVRNQAVL